MKPEERRRVTGLKIREADNGPGELHGTAIKYGDVGQLPWGNETFAPGSVFLDPAGVILNRQHDRGRPLSRYPDGGMDIDLASDAVRIRARIADTQDGRDTVALVRSGIMRGLSVGFVPEDDAVEDGVRVIRRARLVHIGVVDDGTYPASEVAAMRASLRNDDQFLLMTAWW